MSTKVTLRDVAEAAGVSMGTASQALNNRPNISKETRERVVEAATKLGYHKGVDNPVVDGNISMIGMLVKHDYGEEFSVNPFYSHVERGLETECRKREIGLMFSAVEVDRQNRPVVWPSLINDQRIDGLLFIGTFIEDSYPQFRQLTRLPIVFIDSYSNDLPYDSIVIDNAVGAGSAIDHLVELGHRHIGLTGTNPGSPPGVLERRTGYQKALRRHGIQHEYIEDCALDRDQTYRATQRLLQRCPQVTAIFSANDDTAIGAMNAIRDMGMRVPEDVSVIGFDNINISRETAPTLSTVDVNKPWLGILGVRCLVNRIQTPEQPRIITTVATQLIPRESTCPPRQ
jgi:LacI family transcriptional regulator